MGAETGGRDYPLCQCTNKTQTLNSSNGAKASEASKISIWNGGTLIKRKLIMLLEDIF